MLNRIQFNPDIADIKQSDIRKMTLECNKLKGINLSQGICDLDLPKEIVDGLTLAINSNYNIYSKYNGIQELREQISLKLKNFNNLVYDFENEIMVTSGSSAAFFITLFSLLKRGDEVIIFQPFYGYHFNTLKALGIEPVVSDLDQENNWKINFEDLKNCITPKTKAILINTPSNPCGKIFSEEEILRIGKLCEENNLFLLTDEIYEYITFDMMKHISPASIGNLKERTITIGGFSKTFSITGWRIGYIAAPQNVIEKFGVVNDLFYICPPTPLQKAVAQGLKNISKEFYLSLSSFYQKNRDLLIETLDKLNVKFYSPKGAYYMLADFSSIGFEDGNKTAEVLLKKSGIAVVPGNSFFINNKGKNFVRFCFAKKHKILKQACANLLKLK